MGRLTKDTTTQGYTAPKSGVWVGEKRLVPIHRVKGRLFLGRPQEL